MTNLKVIESILKFALVLSFQKDPSQIQEIRGDIRSEGAKFGEVRKVTVYDVSMGFSSDVDCIHL